MELLERFALGDLEAFESLFRQFQGEVYGSILRLVRDPGTAEDLTVETFWRIYRARARFDPARSFVTWARRIASNAALDQIKASRAEILLPADLPDPRAVNPAVERDLHDQIRAAFRRLPAKLQAVATLALIEEKPQAVIAAELGISAEAVKSRQFRAVRLLRKELKRLGVEP